MQRPFREISRSEQGTSTRNEDTELPRWLSDIVARFKQSHLTLSIDDLGQLNLSESLKAFLIEVIMCADKDKYLTSNSQLLQEIKELGIKQIEEIRSVVDVRLRSQDQKSGNTYVQTQILIPVPVVIPKTFSGAFGVPPRFANFTGREVELGQLKDNVEKPLVITQKIAGTGGIGKSQLAATFAYQMLERFTESEGKAGYRSVIWFIANTDEGIDNQGLMTEQMFDLGRQLGFDPNKIALKDLIRVIFQRLQEEYGPFLVVFDNAHDFRSIKTYLPPSNIPVIVTTRNNNERDFQQFKSIALTIFSQTEALAYIKKVLSVNHPDLFREEEAKELASALGYFPLALTQALAYITTENTLISKYIEKFKSQKEKYLKYPLPQDDNFQEEKNPSEEKYQAIPRESYDAQKATIWAVIKLSLKKVKLADAHQILKVCAYLAPEAPIDTELLAYWTTTFDDCVEAVAALRHYSLLENVSSKGISGHVQLHELVQEILRLSLTNEDHQGELLTHIVQYIGKHYNKKENPLKDESRRIKLYPHYQAILQYFTSLPAAKEHTKRDIADMLYNMGQIHALIGNSTQSFQCFQQALETCESLYGVDHLETTKFLISLGTSAQNLGDSARAKALLENALAIQERNERQDNSLRAINLASLGAVYLALGKPTIASSLLEKALAIQKTSDEFDQSQLAITLADLGSAMHALGNYAGAKIYMERALTILEGIYGSVHPLVAKTLDTLSTTKGELGHHAEAKILLERALNIQEGIYGSNHPEVAKILVNLGAMKAYLGENVEAKPLLERALAIQERAYGADHVELSRTLKTLGATLLILGDASGADTLLRRTLAIEEGFFGADHPEVSKTLAYLGDAKRALGDMAEAESLLERALVIQEGAYGADHPELARVLVSLCEAKRNLGEIAKAKALLERARDIKERFYGSDHIEVAITLLPLGNLTADLGNATGAITHFKRALPIFEQFYGPDHPIVSSTLEQLGIATSNIGDIREAITHFKRALTINELNYGSDDLITAKIHFYLGVAHKSHQPTVALEHFMHCQSVFSHHYGDQHPYTQNAREYIRGIENANLQHSINDQSDTSQKINRKKQLQNRFKTNDPAQAIRQATANGELSELSNLLQEFPDQANQPDQNHDNCFTALHLAVKGHQDKHVAVLLDCIGFTTTTDAKGCSALDYALQENNTEILHHFRDALLKKYSQLKITPTQLPKLVRACAQNGDVSGLKLLMHLKVPCDEPGPTTGQTALHLAVIKRHVDCMKLLMTANADPNKKDGEGQTPLSLSENKPEIRAALTACEENEHSATTPPFH